MRNALLITVGLTFAILGQAGFADELTRPPEDGIMENDVIKVKYEPVSATFTAKI